MKRKIFYSFILIILLSISAMLYSVDFSYISSLPNSFYISMDEIAKEKEKHELNKVVVMDIGKQTQTSDKNSCERVITYKLFGIIPIKKIVAKMLPEEDVYVGGNAVGISLQLNQGIVVSQSEFGKNSITLKSHQLLREGDVIYKINGSEVHTLQDIAEKIENSKTDDIAIEYYHNGSLKSASIKTAVDDDGEKKIGYRVKDDIRGIGTITYICSSNGKFGALGHEICNNTEQIDVIQGGIYDCKMIGIDKGEVNNPGQLKCVFVEGRGKQGDIEINSQFGVFGKIDDMTGIDKNIAVKLGGRLSVKPGKAKIVSSVSGIREEYDIEIIRAYNQNEEKDKSFVFRVIDKKLLELTGGIVQGMSGSPIIQNGKMVGAVTHVFTADPTKGYGVYTDWMIENNL